MFRNFFIISIFFIHINNIISTEKVNVKCIVYKLNNGKGEIKNYDIEVDKNVKGDLKAEIIMKIEEAGLLGKRYIIKALGVDNNDLEKVKITKEGIVIFIKEGFEYFIPPKDCKFSAKILPLGHYLQTKGEIKDMIKKHFPDRKIKNNLDKYNDNDLVAEVLDIQYKEEDFSLYYSTFTINNKKYDFENNNYTISHFLDQIKNKNGFNSRLYAYIKNFEGTIKELLLDKDCNIVSQNDIKIEDVKTTTPKANYIYDGKHYEYKIDYPEPNYNIDVFIRKSSYSNNHGYILPVLESKKDKLLQYILDVFGYKKDDIVNKDKIKPNIVKNSPFSKYQYDIVVKDDAKQENPIISISDSDFKFQEQDYYLKRLNKENNHTMTRCEKFKNCICCGCCDLCKSKEDKKIEKEIDENSIPL